MKIVKNMMMKKKIMMMKKKITMMMKTKEKGCTWTIILVKEFKNFFVNKSI